MTKAQGGKRAKDLSAKPKAKKVKGGNLSDDARHLNRDVGRVNKLANDAVVKPVKRSGKTIQDTVH